MGRSDINQVMTRRSMTLRERYGAFIANAISRFREGKVINPCPGYPVTYRYGAPNSRYQAGYHTGEDHAAPEGSRLVATSYGRVVFSGWGGNLGGWGAAYGNMVIVETFKTDKNGEPYRYAYCHLSRIQLGIVRGVRLVPGKSVGYVGSTGNVTGPHVHFEARQFPYKYGDDVHPMRVKRNKV